MYLEITPGRPFHYVTRLGVYGALVLAASAILAAVRAGPAETATGACADEEAANACPFTALPLADPYRITSPFGERRDPSSERTAFHAGLDFGAPYGAEVRATGAGVVSYAGRRAAYGLLVEIDHGRGWRTRYAHLRGIDVKHGQSVTASQRIGSMGSSRRSTAPHLHVEVWKDGKLVDPATVLPLPENKQGGHTE